MPCYSIPRAYLHEEVEKIEARGERVTTVVPDGPTILVVTTTPLVERAVAAGYERRLA